MHMRFITRNVPARLLCLIVVVQSMAFGASHQRSAAEVVELIFTSLYSDRDDIRLARQLDQTQMSERLAPGFILYFRSQGVGPRTMTALQKLRDRTALLPPPAEQPFSIQPIPSTEEQVQMLQRIVRYARSYVAGLPNFLCDQVTERYTNMSSDGRGQAAGFSKRLHHTDTMKWSLRFVDGVENGNLLRKDINKLRRTVLKSGQSLSRGEFGEDLLLIFGSNAPPQFAWHHWERLRGKQTAVFSYFMGPARTRYEVSWSSANMDSNVQTVRVPIQGLAYVDPATGAISRLIIQTMGLPASSPIKESRTIIDYGAVDIGGQPYIVPLKASLFIRADPQMNWNEISFVRYRKFETESVVTYTDSNIRFGRASKK